jgi:hypothetical protein
VSFLINALRQRVSKTSPAGMTLFAYDEQGHLIGEYGATGNLIEETVWLANTLSRRYGRMRPSRSTLNITLVYTTVFAQRGQ